MAISKAHGFTHKQKVASATWVITHGPLDGSKCAVEVFVDLLGERVKMIPKNVAMSADKVTVTFSSPQTGEAYVI